MPNEETTTKLKVDITELKQSMQEAKRAANLADSEFKKVASTCDDWTKSSDAISAKLKSLNSTMDSQKAKLSLLEAQYAEVVAEQGKGSKAAQELEIKMNKQQATINKTEREIGSLESSLGEVIQAEKIAAKTGKSVSDVLDDMRDSAEDAEDGFSVLKGSLATFAGNVMTNLAGAAKDGIMKLAGLADETREYRTELAKMSTAATQAGADTDYIKNKWHDMSSVLGDEGAVGEGLNNLMAAGYNTKEELDGITAHLEGAAIKWKDTLKFEGLADGLQETLATGAAVGPFSEMLERSGVNLEKFDAGLAKCTTEADKQNYVLQQLNKLGLSEVSGAYRDQNADLIAANKANSDYTDTMATLGAKIEPVTTALKTGFNELLQKVLELVKDVDMEAFTTKIEEGFAVLKDDVLPAIKDGFQWILDNKDLLIAGITGIAAGFATFKAASLINTAVDSFKKFKKAQEGATVAQWLMNAAMNANPIMLIVTAVVAVVAAIVAFVVKNDEAREKIVAAWNKVKEFVGKAIDAIVKFFTDTIPKGLEKMISFFKELPGKIWTWLSNVISKVSTWASDMAAKGKAAAVKLVTAVVGKIKEIPSKIADVGKNLVQGIWKGISGSLKWIKDKIKGWVGNVTKFLKKLFKIESPSKLWRDEIGVWLARGIAVGIEKGTTYAKNALTDLSEELLASEQKYLDESARIAKEKEDAAYQEKLAAAKTAEELEKVKQDRLKELAEKEQETYLETLKATADKEKEIFENAVSKVEEFIDKAVEKSEELKDLQKSIADTFKGEGASLTYQSHTFNGVETIVKLADVGADNVKLKNYNTLLDKLYDKRGVLPAEIAGYLSEMGMEEGTKYVQALLNASDEEYNKYLSALEEKARLAQEISEKVTVTQMSNLGAEIFNMAAELPETFADIGIDSATEFGAGLVSKLGDILMEVKSYLGDTLSNLLNTNVAGLTSEIVSKLHDDVSTVKAKISGVSSSLNGTSSGTGATVVKNYTQNIFSPTPASRLTIYRNTKNLLGLA